MSATAWRHAVSIIALALFACGTANAQWLIQEVVSREYGINVGAVSDPEIKEVVSREVGLFVEAGRTDLVHEVVSREFSIVRCDTNAPPAMGDTTVAVTVSPRGDTVTLNWGSYNQWAVRDVGYYAVYYSSSPFTSVTNMTPLRIVPGEQLSITMTGLTEWVDHFFAVVPVDGLGNFNPSVVYSAAYVLMPQVISREVGMFVGQGPDNQVISREYSMVKCDTNPPPQVTDFVVTPSPDGSVVTLNWSTYNQWAVRDVGNYAIYYSSSPFTSVTNMTPLRIVPGETLSTTFTGLTQWVDHFFAVVPVDGVGNYNSNVIYSAAYVLMPQVISREFALFVGQGPDKQVISREYSFVRGSTNVPAAVTYVGSPFAANASISRFAAIDLDWTAYNEWAERDIVRYRVYVATNFFSVITNGMTPWAYSANGTQRDTITNLGCEATWYVAVAAEDVVGNFNSNVYAISSLSSVCQLGDVSNLVGDAYTTNIRYTWDLGGVGTDLGFFVNHFRVYFNGSLTPVIVSATNRSWIATNLTPDVVYTARVATVDLFGTESAGASVAVMAGGIPLRWDVDGGTTNAQDGSGSWLAGGTNWWNGGANTNWSNTKPDRAIFGNGGTAGVVSLAGPVSVWHMTFNPVETGAYTIVSNTLTLVATPSIVANTNATISSAVAGSGFNLSGGGTLTLSGNNTYTGTTRISGSTIRAGRTNALGTTSGGTVITNGGTLDINGQNLQSENITVRGSGVDGQGAIVNRGSNQVSALRVVTMIGDTTVGGTGRWDIRATTSASLNQNGYTLTKVGTNQFSLVGVTATNDGDMVVNEGVLSLETTSRVSGAGSVIANPGGTIQLYSSPNPTILKTNVLNGGTLQTSSGVGMTLGVPVIINTNSTFNIGGGDLTLTNIVSGAGGFTKTGANVLTLAGANTFSGDILANSGTVRLASSGALGNCTNVVLESLTGGGGPTGTRFELSGGITVGSNVLLTMPSANSNGARTTLYSSGADNTWLGHTRLTGNGSVTFYAMRTGTTFTIGGPVTGTSTGGILFLSGEGGTGVLSGRVNAPGFNFTKVANTSTWVVAASSNVWGLARLLGGTLRLSAPDALPHGTHLLIGNGAVSDALLDLGGFTHELGSLSLSSTGGSILIGNSSTNSDATLVISGATNSAYGAPIVDAVLGGTRKTALAIDGGCNLTLTGTNTFTGGITVRSGILQSSRQGNNLNSAIPPGAPVNVLTGAVLRLGALDALGWHSGNPSLVILDGGTQTIITGVHASVGSYRLRAGTITSEGAGNATGNYIFDGRIETLSNESPSVLSAQRVYLRATNGPSVTFDTERGSGATDLLVSAVLTGSAGLVKGGSGVLLLVASNTYPGATAISNGTLLVNGSISTGAVAIAAAGSLGGTGVIHGPVISSGTVAPGASAGVLTMLKPYVQNGGAALAIEIGGTAAGSGYDVLVVSNTATLGGALNVSLIGGFVPALSNSFTVLRATTLSGTFATTNLPVLSPGLFWSVSYPANTVVLSVTGAPPSGYDAYAQQITNAALRGIQDDADGDGYANLLEYVTGGSPTNGDSLSQMSGARTNGLLSLRFTRDTNAMDATLIVEGSHGATNDAAWLGFATNLAGSWGGATNVVESGGTNPVNVSVFDTEPFATNRFLRLRVTRP